jgi:hypothetical protein
MKENVPVRLNMEVHPTVPFVEVNVTNLFDLVDHRPESVAKTRHLKTGWHKNPLNAIS